MNNHASHLLRVPTLDRLSQGAHLHTRRIVSESRLPSDYIVHRGQEGAQRAVGLHTLMSYNDLRHGTKGDPYFKRPNGVLETVPIWYVR